MNIISFDEKYADEMIELYQQEYSEVESHTWSYEKAKESLEVCWKYFSDVNFVALNDNGQLMGGIFNLVNPYFHSDVLFIISFQVKPEFRGNGVATALLKKAVDVAKEKGITGVRLLTNDQKNFPKSWYEKIGFQKSGYTEYAANVNKINL